MSRLAWSILLGAAVGCAAPDRSTGSDRLHPFLKGYLGTWAGESAVESSDGASQVEMKGDTVVTAAGSWIVMDGTVQVGEQTLRALFSIGYDRDRDRFYATWIDSTYPYAWTYEGQIDDRGKVLTLQGEGPSKFAPNARAHYREVLTQEAPDRRRHDAYVSTDGVKWMRIVSAASRRVR